MQLPNPGGLCCRAEWDGGPGVVLILCICGFCRETFQVAVCPRGFRSLFALWSPYLWRCGLASLSLSLSLSLCLSVCLSLSLSLSLFVLCIYCGSRLLHFLDFSICIICCQILNRILQKKIQYFISCVAWLLDVKYWPVASHISRNGGGDRTLLYAIRAYIPCFISPD